MRGKELYTKLLAEQRKWIAKCGGDLAGYIANYHRKHGRTLENTQAIYQADTQELERLQRRLATYR